MNGKQARMLRQMRATNKEKKVWKILPKHIKGIVRKFHRYNPKMIRFGLLHTFDAISLNKEDFNNKYAVWSEVFTYAPRDY